MFYFAALMAHPETETEAPMKCRNCGGTCLRRVSRSGFLQLKILPFFGLYPWVCEECGEVRLYRKRSRR